MGHGLQPLWSLKPSGSNLTPASPAAGSSSTSPLFFFFRGLWLPDLEEAAASARGACRQYAASCC